MGWRSHTLSGIAVALGMGRVALSCALSHIWEVLSDHIPALCSSSVWMVLTWGALALKGLLVAEISLAEQGEDSPSAVCVSPSSTWMSISGPKLCDHGQAY